MQFQAELQAYQPQCRQEACDQIMMLQLIEQFSERLLYRDNAAVHLTASALVFNQSLDKILLVQHHIYQTWCWTGGHADGNGDLLQVALQETREEAGLNAQPLTGRLASLDILPVYGHNKQGCYVSAHLHLSAAYVLIADETQAVMPNYAENSAVGWFEKDKLDRYSNEQHMLYIYNKLIRRTGQYG